MRFISLFSGIGGFDLGFTRAGWIPVAQVEIDDWCRRVLTKHWSNVPKFKDVKDVGKHNLPATDVIVGGFPCQPHSVAGQRQGIEDDRNLWPDYLRIIREVQPRFVIGENVPGLRTTMLDLVLSDLDSAGYTTTTLNIPAVAFDAPHLRERLFIVAHSNSARLQRRQQRSERRLLTPDNISTQSVFRGFHNDLPSPRICRGYDGIPNRIHRLRGLGNSVLPQAAEWLAITIEEYYGNV